MQSWRDTGILAYLSSNSIKLLLEWSNFCSQKTLNLSHKLVICQIMLLVLLGCCFFLCFKRIKSKLVDNYGFELLICERPALFDVHLQQLLNLLFKFRRENRKLVNSVDQQLWLAASCYLSGWKWELYYITFYHMPLPFFGGTSQFSTRPVWWLMKVFRFGENSELFLLMLFLLDISTCFYWCR